MTVPTTAAAALQREPAPGRPRLTTWHQTVFDLPDGRLAALYGNAAYALGEDGLVDFEQPVPVPDDYKDTRDN